ncbi:hypothetical protein L3X38_003399 [Prunus dulcis]|uniref:Reverse transcriptase domain-containing protein n=1 Tax=Prunus dulcis TaxID=3755 RepID=A0AAD5F205_PRUDU|nr:hypothetical protein L3X38_003399 [Prunus dulcis]
MFAWSPSDMPGIDPNIICHRLHINPTCKPVAQKKRNFAPQRVAIIEAEIDKLLAASFIEEVSYSEWLANVVLVAKQEKGKWRVCVDYTDLNKACPKDSFPLPRIDQLVDFTSGNQLLSFLDPYSDYNRILMHEDDKVKTSFIIERGTYCYKVMPFGLKNAGATYQRLVNKIFKEHIGKTMEVYVDDMLVKAPKRADHIGNLAEAFSRLCQYRIKLNPIPGEDLFVYLTMSNSVVNSALIREELEAQHPVSYTSKALLDAETGYPKLENLILALAVSARKLRPYYQAHRVIVMTDFPLRSILHSPDASQRLMKWAIELSQSDLLYRPKTVIKAQVLADFVAEFTPSAEKEKLVNQKKESSKADGTSAEPSQPRDMWQLRGDGALNQKGAGAESSSPPHMEPYWSKLLRLASKPRTTRQNTRHCSPAYAWQMSSQSNS